MPGDRKTLLSTFLEQRDALLRFLGRRLNDASLAEDLTQETWLRAARVDGAAAIDNPSGYLFRIAANLVRDHQRHAAHHVELQAPDGVVASVADARPSPEAAVLHRDELDRLMRAVDGLSPRCREVFILARIEGLTYGEVAARLGIARTTVITHMVTALAALERAMEERAMEPRPMEPEKKAPGGSTVSPPRTS